jgi:hypothetical protein
VCSGVPGDTVGQQAVVSGEWQWVYFKQNNLTFTGVRPGSPGTEQRTIKDVFGGFTDKKLKYLIINNLSHISLKKCKPL